MLDLKINKINTAIAEWFENNPAVNKIAAKELMPIFMQKGIFLSNPKDGLRIREILRDLDKEGNTDRIPFIHAERKAKNTNWFFIRNGTSTTIEKTLKRDSQQKIITSGNKKKSFLPLVDVNSRTLILGTVPGDISLSSGEYYANKSNQFWKIMNNIYGNLPDIFDAKCRWLLQHEIALWDVIAHADRVGSLDSMITNEYPNDLKTFFKEYPKIMKVCFNGKTAQDIFAKYFEFDKNIEYKLLPSSSSALTIQFKSKVDTWRKIIGE